MPDPFIHFLQFQVFFSKPTSGPEAGLTTIQKQYTQDPYRCRLHSWPLALSLSIFISRYDLFFSLVRFACERSGDCYYHYPYYFCNCRYSSFASKRATNFVKQTLTRQFGHQLLLERNNFLSSNFL